MVYKYKLSVVLITYNHEKFIIESLNSILRQKLNVSWELIIAEDGSTDRTRDLIVNHLYDKDIEWKINSNKDNRGIPRNFADGILSASGEYIALMSGDDFFLGEYTLNSLLSKLDTKKACQYVMYCGNCIEWDSTVGNLSVLYKGSTPIELDRRDFYFQNPITGLVLFRNIIRSFPEIFYKGRAEDRQFWMMLASKGKIKINPFLIGRVYRRHDNSFTKSDKTNRIEGLKNRIESNLIWGKFFNDLDQPFFQRAQDLYRKKLIIELFKSKKFNRVFSEHKLLFETDHDDQFLSLKSRLLFKALKFLSF